MTTQAAPQAPVTAPPRRGGAPARRAIRRWAWRLLRREWRQQALVIGLLIVAVAATTVGLGLVINVQGSAQGVFGNGNVRVDIAAPGPGGVAADLAVARQRFGTVEAIEHESVPVPGSITPVDLRAEDPHGVLGAPMLRLVSGRYPVGAAQVAVTAAVAATFHLKLGSVWTVHGRSLSVVGLVENPRNLQDAFGLVPPGELPAPSGLTLLFDASPDAFTHYRAPAGAVQGIMSAGATNAKQQRAQALSVLLLATIGLAFIGLLSVAGFTVMAQRRQRALGMVAAIGATDRQVRRVLLANGAAVGAVGALVGAVLGLTVWFALTPAFEKVVGHRYDPLAIPWWAVVAGALLAILTAVFASWWPARTAARLPIVAALSGRPAPPRPAHRFALLGTALAAVGFVCLIIGHGTDTVHTVPVVVGILATSAGMLLLAPLGIRAVAAVAGRAPVGVRLALRDLARYQARSGAALAAGCLAVGIAAAIAVTTAAQQAHDRTLSGGNLPNNQLIVWIADPNDQGPGMTVAPADAGTGPPAVPNPAVVAAVHTAALAIAQTVGAGTLVPLDCAVDLTAQIPAGAPPGSGQAGLVRPMTFQNQHEHGFSQVTVPYVATTAVLHFYGIDPRNIAPSADIITARRDLTGTQLGTGFGSGSRDFRAVTVQVSGRLPNYTSAPNTLITPQTMHAHGYMAEPVGWLVQSGRPLTAAQIAKARQRAAAAGITVETRTGPNDSLQRLRDYATGAGLVVALGVLAMTVGLIRSETTRELRTLAATGASGTTRRTMSATSAGALGLLAGILGTAAAYLALIAWNWHDLDYLDSPPYADLAAVVVGLPALAAAGSWLLGRTPGAVDRRPLD